MGAVLVLGALHLDVVVDAPRLPRLDETLFGSGVAYRFGGKGGNQALAARRMGARVAMAGRVGCDRAARQVTDVLDVHGIDRSRVAEVDGDTGMSVAIVDHAGDYGAVVVSGVNAGIDGAEALPADSFDICLLQNEIPEAANLALAATLPETTTLILNAAPARPLPDPLRQRIDILVTNRLEATDMSGEGDPAVAIAALSRRCRQAAIVTLGAEGALVQTPGNQPVHLPTPTITAISSHGAGDMFVGALAAELAEGRDLEAAIRFAQAAAARHVATPPDQREDVDREKVARFLEAGTPEV